MNDKSAVKFEDIYEKVIVNSNKAWVIAVVEANPISVDSDTQFVFLNTCAVYGFDKNTAKMEVLRVTEFSASSMDWRRITMTVEK